MKLGKGTSPRQIITVCVLFTLIVVIESIQVIYSPYIFVKIVNLIVIILLSSFIGALVRELFTLKRNRTEV